MLDLQNKKVAVFGLGVSGLSALKLLTSQGALVSVVNSGEPNLWFQSNQLSGHISINNCFSDSDSNVQELFAKQDLIVLSPGIPREHVALMKAVSHKVKIWNEIELAYQLISKKITLIGITGTNGKTTTTTLVGEILDRAGKKIFVGGNIGVPFCDFILNGQQEDVVVLELSSFQLESLETFKLDIAVFLNLYQNHGERYQNIQDYAKAKFHLTDNMTEKDLLIYPKQMDYVTEWALKQKCRKIPIDFDRFDFDQYDVSTFRPPGMHNKINLSFALQALQELNLDRSLVQKAINEFRGVHFRIEYIQTKLAMEIFNDAKSTNWDATLTAVKAMEKKGRNLYLILGGKKRGHGDSIRPYLNQFTSSVDKILLIGEMQEELASELQDGNIPYVKCATLENVKKVLISETFNGILLFSPAFPSFDQFKNYVERGERFTQLFAD